MVDEGTRISHPLDLTMCDRPHSARDAHRVDCTTGSVVPQERFPNVMCIVFVSSPPCKIGAGGPLVDIFYPPPSPAKPRKGQLLAAV